MTASKTSDINFGKYTDGLVPVVVQDPETRCVLMVGFMNAEAYRVTESTGKVTFHSRSRKTLWTKGETSGHFLMVKDIIVDCDADTILIKATPTGPVCHTGDDTCFSERNKGGDFISNLEELIRDRKAFPVPDSYTSKLFTDGINRIAQKVGEESVELVIEALHQSDPRFISEAADLLYHVMVLLTARDIRMRDVISELESRHRHISRTSPTPG